MDRSGTKEGTQKVLKYLGGSFNFISKSKFLAVNEKLMGIADVYTPSLQP
jgi:hypothetical protein